LDYYKDYRSYDRIGFDYGVQGPAIYKVIVWVENTLIRNESFHLSKKKALQEGEFDIILVDCTESPVQRPKKNSKNGTQASKKTTR
jgi:hypothetical protein